MSSIRIVVDPGELRSGVVKALEKQGVEIEVTKLEAGDYVANHRIAFERMTIDDFIKSIFEDRRLFSRIKYLANSPYMLQVGHKPEGMRCTAKRGAG